MSFVRSGPRILIVEPKDDALFRSFLTSHFENFKIPETVKSLEDIISVMKYNQTLIYITKNAKLNITDFEIDNCVILEGSCQSFLMKALNSNGSNLINYVRRAPRIIIMKVIGSVDKTVDDIAEDFKATIESTKMILSTHSDGTVIFFTKGNINKKLEFADFFSRAVYTTEHFSTIINMLDHHALKYINRNTENKDWFDLTINIRDKYEDFKTHYDRLIYTLDCLGAGMVLKEGLSEETGRFFTSTGVYKLALYTYLEPLEVKKILLALEYMENGERIVDFDLYYKKKKIHWEDVKIKGINEKENLSHLFRQNLYKSLEDEDIEYLRSIEDYIFASR